MPDKPHRIPAARAFFAVAACTTLGLADAGSLTLEQAIREALANGEEAQLLNEKAKRFDAVKDQAWSGAYPRISAYANAGRGASPFDLSSLGFEAATTYESDDQGLIVNPATNRVAPNPPSTGGPSVINIAQNRFSYGLEAQQSLFTFGRLGLAIRTASKQERANNSDRKRSIQQLQLSVLDAYYGSVAAKARLATLDVSLKRSKETVAFLESNFKMGSGQRSSVLMAITALKSLEPERIRAERDAESARMALNRMLGRPLDSRPDLDTSVHIQLDPIAALPDSQALQELIGQRPDVQAMELNRQSLEGQARYLKMQYLPSLGAQAKVGVLAYKLNQLGEVDDNREWSVGLGLTWPLFDGFGMLAQARQVQSDARSLGLGARQARKMMQIEIESAWRDFKAADTALAAARQAVEAAEAAQAMLSEEFRAGKGMLTTLLEAEEMYRETALGYLAADNARIRSQAALRLTLGKALINEEVR